MDNNLAAMRPGDVEMNLIVDEIKAKRFTEANRSMSLRNLAMKSIVFNHEYFLKQWQQDFNPMNVLPNSIIQDFFKNGRQFFGNGSNQPTPICREFLWMFLNENLMEFDFNEDTLVPPDWEQGFFYYMKRHCCNLKKIVRGHENFRGPMVIKTKELLRWSKLTYMGFRNYTCTDEQLKKIQESIPQLQGMEISVKEKSFTEKAIEPFSKMLSLTHLELRIEGCRISLETVVHCVGKIPNLKTFALIEEIQNSGNRFLELYAEHYPNKKLILTALCIHLPFKIEWPANIIAQKLHIETKSDCPSSVEKLIAMPFPPSKLIVHAVPNLVHPIVEKFGPHLRELTIKALGRAESYPPAPLGLYAIEKSPNLQVLTYTSTADEFEEVDIPFAKFKNWKRYDVTDDTYHAEGMYLAHNSEADRIFKMFLLGSEKSEQVRLHLKTPGQINVLEEVLTIKPNSHAIKKLIEVSLDLYSVDTIKPALKIVAGLIYHCPSFELVKFRTLSDKYELSAEVICRRNSWFKHLTTAVGVKMLWKYYDIPQRFDDFDEDFGDDNSSVCSGIHSENEVMNTDYEEEEEEEENEFDDISDDSDASRDEEDDMVEGKEEDLSEQKIDCLDL
ncbi:uncharacterized protein LOC132194288 isoform X2 [Neocloeon triangulifer]|uniref:uncharacterized protein LOC132194288 isoform X2 n=1 Tax=Neocloeon triangulifer TaxID=2078957 RepID=UPI00286EB9B0|nr:uncharacterized protein LOC132194288 isoform X2 [Neocloeon triangulifer]